MFAELPLGAASLSTNVKGGRALRTDYMLAGQYALPPDAAFSKSDLRGSDCSRATHVVSAVYVGAFVMSAGESREMDAKATLFSARARGDSLADINVLKTEGDPDACAIAQKEGKENYGCAVPLRIGLSVLETQAPLSSDSGTMAHIPGGTYLMGSPPGEGNPNEHPQQRVTVEAFGLDVTVRSPWRRTVRVYGRANARNRRGAISATTAKVSAAITPSTAWTGLRP